MKEIVSGNLFKRFVYVILIELGVNIFKDSKVLLFISCITSISCVPGLADEELAEFQCLQIVPVVTSNTSGFLSKQYPLFSASFNCTLWLR